MWVETRLIIDGGYQEAIIQPTDNQDAVVLKIVEVGDNNQHTRLYMSYDETLRLADELINYVNKNRGK
jgi:hypothetical protein